MKINKCEIIKAEKGDMKEVLGLIQELAEFENAADEVSINVAQLEKDAFGTEELFQVLLAKVENKVVGMALYYNSYSTWKGRMLYLEDLYVQPNFRKMGIASKLMDAIMIEAKKKNVKRIKWQVLDWNKTAIEFYKKRNAQFDSEWINCDIYEEQIKNFKA